MGSLVLFNDSIALAENEAKNDECGDGGMGIRKNTACEEKLVNYVLCFDNEKLQRHCPQNGLSGPLVETSWASGINSLFFSLGWLWDLTQLGVGSATYQESRKNRIKVKGGGFIFPGSETKYPNGADEYLNWISDVGGKISNS